MSLRDLDSERKRSLGRNLIAARTRAGLKQNAAAKRARIPQARLSLWENGHQAPMADGLLRLAVLYGCPLDDFFGGVDEDYDAIIERRIPVDAKRFDQARLERLKALTMRAMQLTVEATGTAAPTPETRAASRPATREKSPATRARRKPKTKKPPPPHE